MRAYVLQWSICCIHELRVCDPCPEIWCVSYLSAKMCVIHFQAIFFFLKITFLVATYNVIDATDCVSEAYSPACTPQCAMLQFFWGGGRGDLGKFSIPAMLTGQLIMPSLESRRWHKFRPSTRTQYYAFNIANSFVWGYRYAYVRQLNH